MSLPLSLPWPFRSTEGERLFLLLATQSYVSCVRLSKLLSCMRGSGNVNRMRQKLLLAATVIGVGLCISNARAETLSELVKKEEGVEFDGCDLTPRPNVAGKDIYVVIPARFADPAVWATRSILFVGVDEAKNIQGMLEVKAPDDVPPREVISVICEKNEMTITISFKTLFYIWDGKELKRRRGGKK